MQKLWFRRKRYGWGWFPITWQGWAVIVVYAAAVALVVATVEEFSKSANFASPWMQTAIPILVVLLVPLTALLMAVCYIHGEAPKWQWGTKKLDQE